MSSLDRLFCIRSWSERPRQKTKISSLSEQSSSFREMVHCEAVVIRNAVKRYEPTKVVIDNLKMTVSRGSIYGLLGPSGCGKTTLLSCIVGIQHLNSGEIWVLGGRSGSKKSGIPGPRVGYMPQEISLVGEFTRNDALYYFGRICGLTDDKIEERQQFLVELLQLPPEDRLVKNMSGGQQRRLSLAAALIHEPELLILDEPTVGLDPILREKIWAHLINITRENYVTVVITTHYIEESKDASKIGLMRNGQLLAESTPQQLLERFQSESLEEVFLTLCQMQDNLVITDTSATGTYQEFENGDHLSQEQNKETKGLILKNRPKRRVSQWIRFKALMAKNRIQFLRHYSGIVFAVLFPILQVSTFYIGIGGDPKGLAIGVVNREAGDCGSYNFGNVWYDEKEFTCHFSNASCKFLQNINDSILAKEYYDDFSEAIAAVNRGKLVGVIHFNQNFSSALQRRVEKYLEVEEADIFDGEISVYLDMGDRQVGLFVRIKLLERFFNIFESMMEDCKIARKYANIPIRFENPVHGSTTFDYRRFMTPAYMMTLLFFLATTISTSLIITDRAEGVWYRSLVQGVTIDEIMLAHTLTNIMITIIHAVMTLCLFLIWGIHCEGSIFLVIVFNFLSGLCGLMYGFFLSVMCTNHTMAHYASAGSLFPLIILCGCLWPVEGMPPVLRWISFFTPITLPSLSLRQVLERGYSIYDLEVYKGILVICTWIVLFYIICLVRLKVKSS